MSAERIQLDMRQNTLYLGAMQLNIVRSTLCFYT